LARIFLGIASSLYEDTKHLPLLKGTIQDAHNIQQILLDNMLGDYNPDLSKLLISPQLSEVHNAIKESLFVEGKIDCFTLYFAGHGVSHRGTYYLCLRDTFTNKLSATALPLNYIFNVINEAQPLQTNIIIDACQAGGVVGDLATLIKPEVFGDAGSPSVSIFGSCMRDEEAEEEDVGGIATLELIKHLNGEVSIDTKWPFLDIVQIGRNVSVELKKKEFSQTPVVWGLSLTGTSTFSKNPHFQPASATGSNTIDLHAFISSDIDLIQHEKEKIWLQFLSIPEIGATPALIQSLTNSVKYLKENGMAPAKIGSFLLGAAEGFSMRVSERSDVFSEMEVLASCGAAFLPIIEESETEHSFSVLLNRLLECVAINFAKLESDMSEPNFLMSNRSGLNDLYVLPIRITKLFGWFSIIQRIQVNLGSDEILSEDRVIRLLEIITANYAESFVCVSDEQAPYLMLFSQMNGFLEGNEVFLLPIRYYLNDFIERKGKILSSNISGEDVLKYLICRNSNEFSAIIDILAQPSELISVLLDAASKSNMDEELDPYMQKIDHTWLNMFLTNDALKFSEARILSGINITMQIGSDVGEGIFTINDFRQNFENKCKAEIVSLQKNNKPETLIAMVFSSLIMPNRVPWGLRKI
jgi:hypothetical protein